MPHVFLQSGPIKECQQTARKSMPGTQAKKKKKKQTTQSNKLTEEFPDRFTPNGTSSPSDENMLTFQSKKGAPGRSLGRHFDTEQARKGR